MFADDIIMALYRVITSFNEYVDILQKSQNFVEHQIIRIQSRQV